MGHIHHLKKKPHFKSINLFEQSYDYMYHKIGPVVLEEVILKLKLVQ